MMSHLPGADPPHHLPDAVEHLLLADHRWAMRIAVLLWVVAGLLFVAMAIDVARDAIATIDQAIYDVTYPVKWAPLTVLAHVLALLGSGVVLWPVRLVVTAYLVTRRRWSGLWVWLLAIAVSEPLIGILKAAYDRPRPAVALVVETTGSFPSGHAVAGSVVALSLVIIFVPAGIARRNLELAAVGFALFMAGSRMYLGAHWFSDVAAGLALGAACVVSAAAVVHRIRPQSTARTPGVQPDVSADTPDR